MTLGLWFYVLVVSVAATSCSNAPAVGDGMHIDDMRQLDVRETARLGDADDPDLGFSQIAGVAVDGEGRVYVLDRIDRRVRVFEREGSLIRVFGRPGEGPGEFQAADGIGLLGDTVWVRDPASRRFTLFTSDGGLLTTLAVPRFWLEILPGIQFLFSGSQLRADGLVSTSFGVPVLQDPPGDSAWVPQLLMNRDERVSDTLWLQRWAYTRTREVQVGGQRFGVPASPSAGPLYAETADGWYVIERQVPVDARTGSIVITRFDMTGDTVYSRAFRIDPAEFPQSAIDALIAPSVRTVSTMMRDETGVVREVVIQSPGPDSAASAAAIRDALSLPRFQAPVSAVHSSNDGSVWVRLHEDGGSTFRWLIVGPRGEPHGIARLPRQATIHWSSLTQAWVEIPDEFEVPWLHRYTMR